MRKRATREQNQLEQNTVEAEVEGTKGNSKLYDDQRVREKNHCLSFRRGASRPALTFRDKLYNLVLVVCIIQWALVMQIKSKISVVHPRIIHINERFDLLNARGIEEISYHQYYTSVEPLLQGVVGKYPRHSFDEGNCKAMHEWQVAYKPMCVPFHEIDMHDSKYFATGHFRNVWWMRDGDGTDAAIKTLAIYRNFTLAEEQRNTKDANAHMALQSSNFIPNIYAFCVNSAIFDVAKGGSFHDMVHDENKERISQWKPKDKLRYAWQMTKGLSDMHSFGNIYNSSAIAHTDIKCNQYLWMDGMFKLNDLNRARFIKYNKKKGKACSFHESTNKGRNRSPEEFTPDADLNEQLDVYSLGNILWVLLMEEKVWKGVEEKKIKKLVRAGHSPVIPGNVLSNYSSAEKAIVHAMNMCFVTDPNERPTAMEVERYLRRKLVQYNVSQI